MQGVRPHRTPQWRDPCISLSLPPPLQKPSLNFYPFILSPIGCLLITCAIQLLHFASLHRNSHARDQSSQNHAVPPVKKTDNPGVFGARMSGLPIPHLFHIRFSKTGAALNSILFSQIRTLSTFPATMIMSISICSVYVLFHNSTRAPAAGLCLSDSSTRHPRHPHNRPLFHTESSRPCPPHALESTNRNQQMRDRQTGIGRPEMHDPNDSV